MQLTNEQKRRSIAEACGWQYDKCLCGCAQSMWRHKDEKLGTHHLPDYLADLNAMHEAEKVLTGEQWVKYVRLLGEATGEQKGRCHATATQRAEAFGRTLNLW